MSRGLPRLIGPTLTALAVWLGIAVPLSAQVAPPASNAGPAAADRMAIEQEKISSRYKRFEEVILRMAELTAPTDPARAELLRKAVGQSKDERIGGQLDDLVKLLQEDRLATALTAESEVSGDLQKLLDLLLTEERGDRLKDERERIKEQIRRLNEIIIQQTEIKAITEQGGDAPSLARGQGKLREETGKLAGDMKPPGEDQKPTDAKPSDPKPMDAKPGDQKPADAKPNDKKTGDRNRGEGKPADGQPSDSKPGEGQPGKGSPGKPGESQSPPGQPGEKDEQPGKPSEEKSAGEAAESTPSAQQRVEEAQQRMEEAQRKLEEAQRDGAAEKQQAALDELARAKAQLEEILRQLREEELLRTLAQLEVRFAKMLQMQMEVYEGTVRIAKSPADADGRRSRNDEIEAGRLSRRESMIVLEADKALAVLHEEGSAVAFPEAVVQMRDDMEYVVIRLGKADVGALTQGTEKDIIAALEEMLAALKKAKQEAEDAKGSPPPSMPQEPPLIDQLAELKMIRSLQLRINTRTKRFSDTVEGEVGQSTDPEVLEQLRELGERQDRVYRATKDIVTGKNK